MYVNSVNYVLPDRLDVPKTTSHLSQLNEPLRKSRLDEVSTNETSGRVVLTIVSQPLPEDLLETIHSDEAP